MWILTKTEKKKKKKKKIKFQPYNMIKNYKTTFIALAIKSNFVKYHKTANSRKKFIYFMF